MKLWIEVTKTGTFFVSRDEPEWFKALDGWNADDAFSISKELGEVLFGEFIKKVGSRGLIQVELSAKLLDTKEAPSKRERL
jgi:hypothetical protein